ncbi:MAG: hypothetical protein WC796_01485 [Candidatus Pacearchaeota archaeon]|jgi:hypothetical protein
MRSREDYPSNVVEIQEHDKACGANDFTVAAYGPDRVLKGKYFTFHSNSVEGHEVLIDRGYSHNLGDIDESKDVITSEYIFGIAHDREGAQDRLYGQAQVRAGELSRETGLELVDTTGRDI